MRTVHNALGYSVIVSNEEYLLLKKIHQRKSVKMDSIKEYYQEMADKLISRGVLDVEENEEGEFFYIPIGRK